MEKLTYIETLAKKAANYSAKIKFCLLPDQIERIQERINLLKEGNIHDSNKKEIKRLVEVLKNHTLARTNYESIDIGTCFTVTIVHLGQARTYKYQLVDFLEIFNAQYDKTGEYLRILPNSLIGDAVKGHKVGDAFEYTYYNQNDEKIRVTGIIDDVKTPAKETLKQI